MGYSNTDTIEVKLYDPTHVLFYKGKTKVSKLKEINIALENKEGLKLVRTKEDKSGWFD